MNTVNLNTAQKMSGFEFFLSPFFKAFQALAGSWAAGFACFFTAFFGANILDIFIQLDSIIKVVSVIVTLGLAVLTFILSRKEKAKALQKLELEYKSLEQDQLKENIEWLIEKEWIPESPTDEEIQDGLKRLRNIGILKD